MSSNVVSEGARGGLKGFQRVDRQFSVRTHGGVVQRVVSQLNDQGEPVFGLSLNMATNHLLHLVISFFLCGAWLPVWLFVALSNNAHNKRIDRRLAGGAW